MYSVIEAQFHSNHIPTYWEARHCRTFNLFNLTRMMLQTGWKLFVFVRGRLNHSHGTHSPRKPIHSTMKILSNPDKEQNITPSKREHLPGTTFPSFGKHTYFSSLCSVSCPTQLESDLPPNVIRLNRTPGKAYVVFLLSLSVGHPFPAHLSHPSCTILVPYHAYITKITK